MKSCPDPQRYIELLNVCVAPTDYPEWILPFINGLKGVLEDVDHILLFFNNLDAGHRHGPLNDLNVEMVDETESRLGFRVGSVSFRRGERYMKKFEYSLTRHGLSVDSYHPPIYAEYFDRSWLGTLLLVREHAKPPISERTLARLEELRPFVYGVFRDMEFRYHATHPADSLFYEAIERITLNVGLTQQEMRVLMYRLLGSSYREIAQILSVSEYTVKNHLRAIHAKAGVHNQTELFARYVMPVFGLNGSRESVR